MKATPDVFDHPPHRLETLAEGPVSSVALCPCGCLHVTLGALTLRLERSAAESLWLTLGEAIAELHDRIEPAPCRKSAEKPS